MTLGELQRAFPPLVAKLIEFAYAQGFELTFSEAWRTPEQAQWNADHGKGIANSLHCERLAIDLNLFKDGVYQTDSEPYKPLADYWLTLHPNAAAGYYFARKDADHFSLSFGGIK